MTGPVLITGAAGFVGSHLLELLQKEGASTVAWRRPNGPPGLSLEGVRWMDVELLDRADVARGIADVMPSVVYHLAGAAHVAQSWLHTRDTYEGNFLASHHLLEALRKLRLKPRVLMSCSAHVYAAQSHPIREDDTLRPSSPYAISKLATEMLAKRACEEDAIPAVIARAFNHVGPRQDPSYVAPSIAKQIAWIEAGRSEPLLTMGSLDPRRDLTDVRDTVRAYSAVVHGGTPGVPYNVCSGRAIAVRDLVELFVKHARCDVRVAQDPTRFRPNDPPLLVGDHSRLTTATGWRPEIPLERTVVDLLEYWRDQAKRES